MAGETRKKLTIKDIMELEKKINSMSPNKAAEGVRQVADDLSDLLGDSGKSKVGRYRTDTKKIDYSDILGGPSKLTKSLQPPKQKRVPTPSTTKAKQKASAPVSAPSKKAAPKKSSEKVKPEKRPSSVKRVAVQEKVSRIDKLPSVKTSSLSKAAPKAPRVARSSVQQTVSGSGARGGLAGSVRHKVEKREKVVKEAQQKVIEKKIRKETSAASKDRTTAVKTEKREKVIREKNRSTKPAGYKEAFAQDKLERKQQREARHQEILQEKARKLAQREAITVKPRTYEKPSIRREKDRNRTKPVSVSKPRTYEKPSLRVKYEKKLRSGGAGFRYLGSGLENYQQADPYADNVWDDPHISKYRNRNYDSKDRKERYQREKAYRKEQAAGSVSAPSGISSLDTSLSNSDRLEAGNIQGPQETIQLRDTPTERLVEAVTKQTEALDGIKLELKEQHAIMDNEIELIQKQQDEMVEGRKIQEEIKEALEKGGAGGGGGKGGKEEAGWFSGLMAKAAPYLIAAAGAGGSLGLTSYAFSKSKDAREMKRAEFLGARDFKTGDTANRAMFAAQNLSVLGMEPKFGPSSKETIGFKDLDLSQLGSVVGGNKLRLTAGPSMAKGKPHGAYDIAGWEDLNPTEREEAIKNAVVGGKGEKNINKLLVEVDSKSTDKKKAEVYAEVYDKMLTYQMGELVKNDSVFNDFVASTTSDPKKMKKGMTSKVLLDKNAGAGKENNTAFKKWVSMNRNQLAKKHGVATVDKADVSTTQGSGFHVHAGIKGMKEKELAASEMIDKGLASMGSAAYDWMGDVNTKGSKDDLRMSMKGRGKNFRNDISNPYFWLSKDANADSVEQIKKAKDLQDKLDKAGISDMLKSDDKKAEEKQNGGASSGKSDGKGLFPTPFVAPVSVGGNQTQSNVAINIFSVQEGNSLANGMSFDATGRSLV